MILEFSIDKPVSEIVLQSVVRNRLFRGAVQLTSRLQCKDELNSIVKLCVSLHL